MKFYKPTISINMYEYMSGYRLNNELKIYKEWFDTMAWSDKHNDFKIFYINRVYLHDYKIKFK